MPVTELNLLKEANGNIKTKKFNIQLRYGMVWIPKKKNWNKCKTETDITTIANNGERRPQISKTTTT